MDLTGRHLLTLKDFSKEEILFLLDLSKKFKADYKKNIRTKPLDGKSLGMIFQKRSTRTRVSTEVGMQFLGGHALFLGKDDIQLGVNETIQDTALVLSRMVDGILARVFGHNTVEELAKYSTVPIINALSDKYHPLQILADLLTIQERFGKLEGLKLVWVGDGNNVCHSLLVGCSKVGMHMTVATPEKYKPAKDVYDFAVEQGKKSGAKFEWTQDPKTAVKGANVIVTDTFVSMGQEVDTKQRLQDFKGFQVTMELLNAADKNAVFMHCLPRHEYEDTN